MAIPDFQTMMLPFLQVVAHGGEHTLRDVVEQLADHFKLSEEERKELLPSGSQFTFANRVGWARTYMSKAGLLESSRRGFFRITERPFYKSLRSSCDGSSEVVGLACGLLWTHKPSSSNGFAFKPFSRKVTR